MSARLLFLHVHKGEYRGGTDTDNFKTSNFQFKNKRTQILLLAFFTKPTSPQWLYKFLSMLQFYTEHSLYT